MDTIRIITASLDDVLVHGLCGYKSIKRPGFPEKIGWLKQRFSQGLRIKLLLSEQDGAQGMLEYIPGEFCWRPVEAPHYLVIHCVFVGFKRTFQGKGYATRMLRECLEEARKEKRPGVAVVTRKGSFMAGRDLFLKNGFQIVGQAPPDFELLVYRFDPKAEAPRFKGDWEKKLEPYKKGLTIIRADQCPYSVKNVMEIMETAKKEYGLKPRLVDLKDHRQAQEAPSPFGTFCIIWEGKVIADHPISNGRFRNIMKTLRIGR